MSPELRRSIETRVAAARTLAARRVRTCADDDGRWRAESRATIVVLADDIDKLLLNLGAPGGMAAPGGVAAPGGMAAALGGLVGEGDGEDVSRRDAGVDEVGGPAACEAIGIVVDPGKE